MGTKQIVALMPPSGRFEPNSPLTGWNTKSMQPIFDQVLPRPIFFFFVCFFCSMTRSNTVFLAAVGFDFASERAPKKWEQAKIQLATTFQFNFDFNSRKSGKSERESRKKEAIVVLIKRLERRCRSRRWHFRRCCFWRRRRQHRCRFKKC